MSAAADSLKGKICALCCGTKGDTRKLFMCSSCNLCVHESCNEDIDGDANETWTCEPCSAGVVSINLACDLCPRKGGLYKKVNMGNWVHHVCALNVPEVTGVELSPISEDKYSDKHCLFCKDFVESLYGLIIKCEQKNCRVCYHATCAFSEGLLARIPSTNGKKTYFARCLNHSSKNVVQQRKNNFKALYADYLMKVSNIKSGSETTNQLPQMRNTFKRFRCLADSPLARHRMAKKLRVLNVDLEQLKPQHNLNANKMLKCREMLQLCEFRADDEVLSNEQGDGICCNTALECIDQGVSQPNTETVKVHVNGENLNVLKRKYSTEVNILCTECKTVSKRLFLMICCNKCKLYYHKQCLKPPIDHKLYRTRYNIWLCRSCYETEGIFWNRIKTRLQGRLTISN